MAARHIALVVALMVGAGVGCTKPTGDVEYHIASDRCDVDVFYLYEKGGREARLQRPQEAASLVAVVPLTRGQRFSISARPMGSCTATCWVKYRGAVVSRVDSSENGIAVCSGVVP